MANAGFFSPSSVWNGSVAAMLEELKNNTNDEHQESLDKILEIVQDLQKKLSEQNDHIQKIIAFISKLYQDGELNKDTFNKLDNFLKDYFDNPYQDGISY